MGSVYVLRDADGHLISAHYGERLALLAAFNKVELKTGDALLVSHEGHYIDILFNSRVVMSVVPVTLHEA